MISVVIPTFERPALLREALKSVAQQTVSPVEVIVSDNHSQQRSEGIAAEFPGLNVRYVWHPAALPVDEHWIWALRQATGPWIALLEDDNLWRRDHLETLSAAATAFPLAGLIGSAAVPFHELRTTLHDDVFAPVWEFDLLLESPLLVPAKVVLATYLCGSPLASSAVMVRRDALAAANPVAIGLRAPQDRWLWAQIATMGGAVFVPRRTVLYREHAAQLVKEIARARHREESAQVTQMIITRMDRLGIEAEDAFEGLRTRTSPSARAGLKVVLCRERQWGVMRRFMPLLDEPADRRGWIGEVIRSYGILLRRKLLKFQR